MADFLKRLRASLLGLSCLSVVLVSLPARAESTPDDPIRDKAPGGNKDNKQIRIERPTVLREFELKTPRLKLGERLDYDIRVNGVPAGKALMEVRKREACGNDEQGPQVWV